jgi:hypothetical protein
MKERPIIFSAPMVRAILDGSKTQTRRAVKPQPQELAPNPSGRAVLHEPCPYGLPGDRLWVREGFKPIASGEVKNGYGEVRYGFAYKADSATVWAERPTIIHDLSGQPPTGSMQFEERPWKSPIHMPHAACRIRLEITDVRVQRVQDISEADALAEGVRRQIKHAAAYAELWDSINGAGAWDANPWVWVVSFARISP